MRLGGCACGLASAKVHGNNGVTEEYRDAGMNKAEKNKAIDHTKMCKHNTAAGQDVGRGGGKTKHSWGPGRRRAVQ